VDYVEIFPGSKRTHFENLHTRSGIAHSNMLFFDNARDGKYGHFFPVSSMSVLTVHCPDGLVSEGIFTNALEKFSTWDKRPTVVESDLTLNYLEKEKDIKPRDRMEGVVKTVNIERRFGIIKYRGGDIFFHVNSLHGGKVESGDKLRFLVFPDPKKANKHVTVDIERISTSDPPQPISTSTKIGTDTNTNTVTMRAFSMNLPFAALLANKYKTLETRNDTMFVPYPPGTNMLLHVGKRIYPDADRHLDVMRSGGLTMDEIDKLKALAPGYGPAMAVVIVELG
jgi:cold shock CspA family protein